MTMFAESDSNKRRIVYVDSSLQKWLLIALVALEVILIAGALWALYLELIATIEANLYRAHSVGKPDINPLLKSALIGLGGLIIINVAVLWIADRLWTRHLRSILLPFSGLINKVEMLDFSADTLADKPHKVVSLAQAWRETERQRLLDLRIAIGHLHYSGASPSPAENEHIRNTLQAILRLLPHQ